MRLGNIVLAFFIAVILLALVSIDPYRTGSFIMPSPLGLETGIIIIAVSFFIVLILLLPKRKYSAF